MPATLHDNPELCALETARARGLKVVAHCSFVRDFLAKRPTEYHDLMP